MLTFVLLTVVFALTYCHACFACDHACFAMWNACFAIDRVCFAKWNVCFASARVYLAFRCVYLDSCFVCLNFDRAYPVLIQVYPKLDRVYLDKIERRSQFRASALLSLSVSLSIMFLLYSIPILIPIPSGTLYNLNWWSNKIWVCALWFITGSCIICHDLW